MKKLFQYIILYRVNSFRINLPPLFMTARCLNEGTFFLSSPRSVIGYCPSVWRVASPRWQMVRVFNISRSFRQCVYVTCKYLNYLTCNCSTTSLQVHVYLQYVQKNFFNLFKLLKQQIFQSVLLKYSRNQGLLVMLLKFFL